MAIAAENGAMQVEVSVAAPLPRKLLHACHASDGERLVVAGGYDGEYDERRDEVLLLEGLNATWRTSTARFGTPKSSQAGVLLGDTLLCLGGRNEVGGGGPVRGFGRRNGSGWGKGGWLWWLGEGLRAAWRFMWRTVEGGNRGVMVAGVGGMVLRSLVRTGMQLPHVGWSACSGGGQAQSRALPREI